jgi:hypothetical protein
MADKTLARSPAVNRGTDDAYGYDSTSTQATVIDLGQPDIGYHYYRRIADDDPPVQEGRSIEISFRQPPVSDALDTDDLKYVVAIPGEIFPDVIKSFNFNDHIGEAVIREPIVRDMEENLDEDNKYNLEAYSIVGEALLNPPEGTDTFDFTIIIDSLAPVIE